MNLKSIINHSVYNDQTEIWWNFSEIHGEINKKSKDFEISIHKILELVTPWDLQDSWELDISKNHYAYMVASGQQVMI